jgi:hypothetical protein
MSAAMNIRHSAESRHARGLRIALAIGAVLLIVVACDDGAFDEIAVDNRTEHPLHFRLFGDGEWHDLLTTAEPGRLTGILGGAEIREHSRLTTGGCTVGELIALHPDGTEVARHPPGLCVHDVWVVEDAPASPAP